MHLLTTAHRFGAAAHTRTTLTWCWIQDASKVPHQVTFTNVDIYTYPSWLGSVLQNSDMSDTSCLNLYTTANALTIYYITHCTVYIQPTSTRLKSRRLLRSYVEHFEREGIHPLNHTLTNYLQNQLDITAPQKPWAQLSQLRTGVGRCKANMFNDGPGNNQPMWLRLCPDRRTHLVGMPYTETALQHLRYEQQRSTGRSLQHWFLTTTRTVLCIYERSHNVKLLQRR